MPLITDTDYSDEIAALPKHAGYSTLPVRTGERYVTLHYSGVVYPKADRAGQLQHILDEAKYQLHHNYGTATKPAYPDGLLYDAVVLDDGWRVLTRARRQQLWHCGNKVGNKLSWAVHLMLGKDQDATEAQWAGCVNIIEQLCALYVIPRMNVVGHNEWPRRDGIPQPSTTYRLLPEQSECPGKVLHARLAAWRATPVLPRPTPVDPHAEWIARWGPVATPTGDAWKYGVVTTWQKYWRNLGKCISHAQYDKANDVIVQCFEQGDVRCVKGACEAVVLRAKE